MESLVLYDSCFGNTKMIAELIAEIIKGKVSKVQDFRSWMLDGISLLIVGCPVHAWRLSKPILEFLASLPAGALKGKNVAAFDTRIKIFFSGSASDKVDRDLTLLGGKSVIAPDKFFVRGKKGPLVEGQLEKARQWAKLILAIASSKNHVS